MLNITRIKDGATFTDSQDSLRQLWEDHYIVRYEPDNGVPDEVPDEYKAELFSIQIADGGIEIAGWYEAEPCLPFELRPEKYTVTLGDSIPRSEVRRVLEERRDEHNKTAELVTHEAIRVAEIAFALEDESIASALSIDLSQKGAEASAQSQKGTEDGE